MRRPSARKSLLNPASWTNLQHNVTHSRSPWKKWGQSLFISLPAPIRTLVLGLAAVLLLSGYLTASASSASAEHAASQAKPRTKTFKGGVDVARDWQVRELLPGTSADFKRFVARRVRWVTSHDCEEAGEVKVYRWRSDGWAVVSEFSCGGHMQIYKKIGGRWRKPNALGWQESLPCKTLRRFDVPPALLRLPPPDQYMDACYDSGGNLIRYT
jgi:hypothetical protein